MARTGWSTSNYLQTFSVPVSSAPLTIAAWVFSASGTQSNTSRTVHIKDLATNIFQHRFAVGRASGAVQAIASAGAGVSGAANTSTTVAGNSWDHYCGVFTNTTSRAAFLNGAGKGTDATSVTPAGLDRVQIGAVVGTTSSASDSTDLIAEVGIWNAALTDAEVAILALGVSPPLVRPSALVAYWPLVGQYSPEIELIGVRGASVVGSLSAGVHPRVFYNPGARFYAKASSGTTNATVNLTGVAGTGFAGTFVPSALPTITGVAGTGAAGTFIPTLNPAFTGAAGTGAAGTFTPGVSPTLTGVAGTGQLGTLTAQLAANSAFPVGVAGIGRVGSISVSIPGAPGSAKGRLSLLHGGLQG